jgi:hypothetical protein
VARGRGVLAERVGLRRVCVWRENVRSEQGEMRQDC